MPRAQQSEIVEAVFAALSRQFGCTVDVMRTRQNDQLEALGLDSHGLLRVLLDIEKALALPRLDLADEALDTPATLASGVAAAIG